VAAAAATARKSPGLRRTLLRWLKPVAFVACLVPLGKIGYDAFLGGGLGANPIEEILNRLGFWTLTLLTITLACTPAKIVAKVTWPLRLRRMLGLFTFAYALLHFGVYVGLDQFFDGKAILEDIAKRKFITFGFIALVLMTPLALTSTNGAVRKLGFARWKLLHRLIYVVAALGLFHFVWRVKADLTKPLLFIAIVSALMLIRVIGWTSALRKKKRAPAPGPMRSAGPRPDAAAGR
jgi:sulfoxide reductase heme-binding subunit YedZ